VFHSPETLKNGWLRRKAFDGPFDGHFAGIGRVHGCGRAGRAGRHNVGGTGRRTGANSNNWLALPLPLAPRVLRAPGMAASLLALLLSRAGRRFTAAFARGHNTVQFG
jgi:hypothetical protein